MKIDRESNRQRMRELVDRVARGQHAEQCSFTEAQAMRDLVDPLSRLVAAGVLLRTARANPEVIALAVDTASSQGWRRPLLAWLNLQARRAEQAGAAAEVERLRRRIEWTLKPP